MQLIVSTNAYEIRATLDAVVAADPVRHTILASIAASPDPDSAWLAGSPGGGLPVAARSSSRDPLALTSDWTSLTSLAGLVRSLRGVASIVGPAPAVDALVTELGRRPVARIEERLFRLDSLTPPPPGPGSARLGGVADSKLLVDWFDEFYQAAFGVSRRREAVRAVDRALATSRIWLWCVDGVPASMAVRRPAAHSVSRVGPVFTPLVHRGRGYGSSVTAAAVADILDEGATPVLFTDLANPTSNKIYRQLGFEPVLDQVHVTLG